MATLSVAAVPRRWYVQPDAAPEFKPKNPQVRVLPGSKMAVHREDLAYDTAVWANPDNFLKPWLALLTLALMMGAMGAWHGSEYNPEWGAFRACKYTDDDDDASLPVNERADGRRAQEAADGMFNTDHRRV